MTDVREIKEFPGYFVRRNGKIYSSISKKKDGAMGGLRLVKQFLQGPRPDNKYLCIVIMNKRPDLSGKPGEKASLRVHRIVCNAFHGKPFAAAIVRHLDGNKENNHADNLAWGTAKENVQDAFRHGARGTGTKSTKRIFKSQEEMRAARAMLNLGIPQESIAAVFGCTKWAICDFNRKRYYCGQHQ